MERESLTIEAGAIARAQNASGNSNGKTTAFVLVVTHVGQDGQLRFFRLGSSGGRTLGQGSFFVLHDYSSRNLWNNTLH